MTNHPTTPMIARVGETRPLLVFGVRCEVLLDGPASGGRASITRLTCAPGVGAPPHRHPQAETFQILRGRLTVRCGGEPVTLEPGDLCHVPPGLEHSFTNEDESEAVLLSIGTPSGHEDFFREADALARSGDFTPQSAHELCRKHGIELSMPPG